MSKSNIATHLQVAVEHKNLTMWDIMHSFHAKQKYYNLVKVSSLQEAFRTTKLAVNSENVTLQS